MEVTTNGDRFGNDDASSIHCFPYSFQMAPSRDFLNEQRRQTFRTEFLVDAEKVNLNGTESVIADTECDRDARDEGKELAFLVMRCSDAYMP